MRLAILQKGKRINWYFKLNWRIYFVLWKNLISYLKLQSCSLSKGCENIFSGIQRMPFHVPSSQQKKKKKNHLKFKCLEKYCPKVWNQIQEISCWKHLFSLQDRGSDRCIYFKRKVPQPVCNTAWKKTLITPTSVAVQRETCQLKRFLCME